MNSQPQAALTLVSIAHWEGAPSRSRLFSLDQQHTPKDGTFTDASIPLSHGWVHESLHSPVATTNAKPDDPSKAQLFQNFIILHTFPCSIPIFLTEVILTINTDFPTSPLFSLSLESKWKLGYGLSVVTCFYKGVSQGILTCLMVAVTATTSQNLNSTGCQIQVIHETYKLASQKGKWQLLTI